MDAEPGAAVAVHMQSLRRLSGWWRHWQQHYLLNTNLSRKRRAVNWWLFIFLISFTVHTGVTATHAALPTQWETLRSVLENAKRGTELTTAVVLTPPSMILVIPYKIGVHSKELVSWIESWCRWYLDMGYVICQEVLLAWKQVFIRTKELAFLVWDHLIVAIIGKMLRIILDIGLRTLFFVCFTVVGSILSTLGVLVGLVVDLVLFLFQSAVQGVLKSSANALQAIADFVAI